MAIVVHIQRFKTNESYKEGSTENVYLKQATFVSQTPIINTYNNETAMSITGKGTDEEPFILVNDKETVDQFNYYGTKDSNERGYYSLPDVVRIVLNNSDSGLQSSIFNIVMNLMSGFKASYFVTTSLATYTQASEWTVSAPENKIGNFKVVVTIHDTITDDKWVLQNTMGFDYVGTPVSLDRPILTDSSLSLALSVDGSNFLQAVVSGMPTNEKRLHFCFERCTQKVIFNQIAASVAKFILDGKEIDIILNRAVLFETGAFTLTGNSIGSPNSLLAETGNFLIESLGVGFRSPYGNEYVLNATKATFTVTMQTWGFKNRLPVVSALFRLSGKNTIFTYSEGIFTVNYGLLYNWYAATDSRNIANTGWHLNTLNEWNTLKIYLDPNGVYYNNIAGGKLKEVSSTSWEAPNVGATNEVGFNAKGSGRREIEEGITEFKFLNQSTEFWVYTTSKVYDEYGEEDTSKAWVSGGLVSDSATLAISTPPIGITSLKVVGFSIRLVKDSTTLSNGQSGTYTGNDGKVYRTICIGTQEWLADTFCETKYRNGDTIPEVTDNSAWAALTTGALCAYSNDWANV